MKIINLTPHSISFFTDDNVTLEIPASGIIARVSTVSEKVGYINNIPIVRVKYGEIVGLPEPKEETIYIVSSIVLSALSGSRLDVVSPDTSPASAVRDADGKIIGVRAVMIL